VPGLGKDFHKRVLKIERLRRKVANLTKINKISPLQKLQILSSRLRRFRPGIIKSPYANDLD
jgi:hypothetical protein